MDLNWTRFSWHLISQKAFWWPPGNTSQAMPGVLTIWQLLTMLNLMGLNSPPTSEEHQQKLPFALGKCPISSTNKSSPNKSRPQAMLTTVLSRALIWKCRGEERERPKLAPWKQIFHLPQLRCPCLCCSFLSVALLHSTRGVKGRSVGGRIPRHCCSFTSHV